MIEREKAKGAERSEELITERVDLRKELWEAFKNILNLILGLGTVIGTMKRACLILSRPVFESGIYSFLWLTRVWID